jgi:cytochrome c5
MGSMARWPVFSGAIFFVTLALAGVRGTSAQDTERGERIMNASCQTCHDVRRIQTAALDADAWTEKVNTMMAKGAKVESADLPVLIEYLARQHGPVPEGAGKRILLNICTMCHDLNRIKHGRRSSEEWEETLNTMLNEGAPLSDAAFPVIHEYLSENFGVD